jgi:hypothetical protein
MGTSFYCEWENVAMAYYTIEYTRDGGEAHVIANAWTGTDIWLYNLPKEVDFNIRITAWNYDDRYDDKKHIIASASVDARSGDYDPGITLNDITVTDGIAHLSWNELGGSTYTVYISADGGEKWLSIASDISDNYYEVNGLDCGKRYDFSVVATSGRWQTRSNTASVTIPERQAGRAEYRALLIGEVSFRGSMRAERNYGDVELIAKALSTVNTPGGSPYTVVRRKDLLDYRIIEEIELTFGDADEDDVSLLFIATHGDYKNMGRDAGCLVTVDSSGGESYMDIYMLADALAKIKGKVIVWLGSCGSGASIYEHGVPQNGDKALAAAAMRAFSSRDSVNWVANDAAGELGNITAEKYDTGELRQEGKFYVLTAARYHERSWGMESERMNYFGKFLSEGITKTNGKMPADGNKDGKVTQNELFHYIKNREEDDEHFINQNVQTYPLDSDYVLFVK